MQIVFFVVAHIYITYINITNIIITSQSEIIFIKTIIKMSNHHCCEKDKCSGTRFGGMYVRCGICCKRSFIECIYNGSGVNDLLLALNIITISGEINYNAGIQKQLKTIFGEKSVFQFTCLMCINSVKEQNIKVKQLESRVNVLTNLSEKKSEAIKQLKDEIANKVDRMNDTNSSTRLTSILDGQQIMHEKFVTSIDKLKQELIDYNVKFTESVLSIQSNCSPEDDVNLIPPVQSDNAHNNVVNESKLRPPQFSMNDPIDLCHNDGNGDEMPMLRPPRTLKKRSSAKPINTSGVFEIFISKFDISVKCEDIIKYIILKTSLVSDDLFTVESLVPSKILKKKPYISFKITTLKQNVFNMIIDESIWSPDFTAKVYVHESTKHAPKLDKVNQKQSIVQQKNKKPGEDKKLPLNLKSKSNTNHQNHPKPSQKSNHQLLNKNHFINRHGMSNQHNFIPRDSGNRNHPNTSYYQQFPFWNDQREQWQPLQQPHLMHQNYQPMQYYQQQYQTQPFPNQIPTQQIFQRYPRDQ